jgi:signal transduction histidine kinase
MIRPAIFSRLGDLLMEQEGRGARVARLLHDDVGPTLSAVGFHLHALGDVEGIGQVRTYLEEVMERVREASQRLHFNPVERSGLAMALVP